MERGFEVLVLGFEISGLGFQILGLGFEVLGLVFEVLGLGFEVLGLLEVLGLALLLPPAPCPRLNAPAPCPPALLSDHTRHMRLNFQKPFDLEKSPGDQISAPSTLNRAHTAKP